MSKIICPKCRKVHEIKAGESCPECHMESPYVYDFRNSEEFLEKKVASVLEERKNTGLQGLVGGLECVIINTEPEAQEAAVEELLHYTGFEFMGAYEDSNHRTCTLQAQGSADILVTSRKATHNPFATVNKSPKAELLPNTRLETFCFSVKNIEKYVSIQESRGIRFLSDAIFHSENYSFIQTPPSKLTGNSIGLIQWKNGRGDYITSESKVLDLTFDKPDRDYLGNIKELDHAATRVKAMDRDAAIIEFMELTNYNFDFAIYVNLLNSITNVARLKDDDFALVFTSGISPYISDELSGPTERFIHNYGTRVHHMAFNTEHIDETFSGLKGNGMDFLLELVGSPQEGLKQTFTVPSRNTMLVNEYIHRYKGFDGFFTKSNVTELTRVTKRQ